MAVASPVSLVVSIIVVVNISARPLFPCGLLKDDPMLLFLSSSMNTQCTHVSAQPMAGYNIPLLNGEMWFQLQPQEFVSTPPKAGTIVLPTAAFGMPRIQLVVPNLVTVMPMEEELLALLAALVHLSNFLMQ